MAEGMARAQEFADMMADRDDEEKDAKYDDTKVRTLGDLGHLVIPEPMCSTRCST